MSCQARLDSHGTLHHVMGEIEGRSIVDDDEDQRTAGEIVQRNEQGPLSSFLMSGYLITLCHQTGRWPV